MNLYPTVSEASPAVSGGSVPSVTGFVESSDRSRTCTPRKKSGRTDYWKSKSRKLPNRLLRTSRRARAGWSAERRARQAELIRRWAPWRQSTGPKTQAGKTRCAQNALRHGSRSRARIQELQRIRRVLRLVDRNIRTVRAFVRLRDARPRIKYKPYFARRLALGANPALMRCLAKQISGGEPCVHWLL